MSLATVVQHVQALETSDLVRTQKLGRTRMCSLNLVSLRSVERNLDRLGQLLDETIETSDPPTNSGDILWRRSANAQRGL